MFYKSLRWLLFKLDPETAHNLAIRTLQPLPAGQPRGIDPILSSKVCGILFPSPIGLAAGFDKDAKAPGRMLTMGFGSVEVGTVTPNAQPGNDSPRVFRLVDDNAIINRFGFNSEGHDAVERRLRRRHNRAGIVGVNLGANKDSKDRAGDYVLGVHRFSRYASYLTINISSPNTPGLRDLQQGDHLHRLIDRVMRAKRECAGPPVFLKVSPDLNDAEIRSVSLAALQGEVDGLIIANTTISRPAGLRSPAAMEPGGLSGEPLKPLALSALRSFATELFGRIPLIGVGGISTASDAYERLRAGASLLQLYSAIAYRGSGVAQEMNKGLIELLKADGFSNISEAVGADLTPFDRHERRVLAQAS